eukprot:TRINITY_DN1746_c0_g2_i7.p1 TRINITY_DN1746_c0_g2~~TRINITY_DN1746_c0_g2_i7.p1  ORF type:complete len:138 (+),score=14.51 TRINITY_DN1746_c0_g2_i7:67-480(+)
MPSLVGSEMCIRDRPHTVDVVDVESRVVGYDYEVVDIRRTEGQPIAHAPKFVSGYPAYSYPAYPLAASRPAYPAYSTPYSPRYTSTLLQINQLLGIRYFRDVLASSFDDKRQLSQVSEQKQLESSLQISSASGCIYL